MSDSDDDNRSQLSCPDRDLWKRFLEERLSDAESKPLEEHLETCAACLSVVEAISRDGDRVDVASGQLGGEDASGRDVERAIQRAIAAPTLRIDGDELAESLPSPFQPGVIVGGYRLIERLGHGGMGQVFLAEHVAMRREVALKVLADRQIGDAKYVQRFAREIRTAAQVNHLRFVQTLDAGDFLGHPYLVMELLHGWSLSDVLARAGRLPVAETCEVARQIVEGLEYLAERGLVHRDLKPSNVMLTSDDGSVRLLDFGVARWQDTAGTSQVATMPSLVVGTLEYMAPEQVESSSTATVRADWYSLGATMFKLLVGKAPLELLGNISPIAKLREIGSQAVPPIRSMRADVPRRLARLIDTLLARDPAKRPELDEVARILATFAVEADWPRLLRELPEETATDGEAIRLPTNVWRRMRRQAAGWWLPMVVVLLLLIISGVAWWRVGMRDARDELANVETESADLSSNQVGENSNGSSNGSAGIAGLSATNASGDPPTSPATTSRRNPFGFDRDVPDTLDDADVSHFAEQGFTQLTGSDDDVNGELWAFVLERESPESLPGEWGSRWKCLDEKHLGWHPGNAELRVVGNRVFILHREETTDYLIEARRDGDRLIGRYINLRGTRSHDSFPWIGRVVGDDRIDGLWGMPRKSNSSGFGTWTNRRWDLRRHVARAPVTITESERFDTGQPSISALALTPDGKTLLTGHRNGLIQVWNLPSRQRLRTVEHHTAEVLALAVSPDGTLAASGGNDHKAIVWRLKDGAVVQSLESRARRVTQLGFVNRGQKLAIVEGDVTVWQFGTNELTSSFLTPNQHEGYFGLGAPLENNLLLTALPDGQLSLLSPWISRSTKQWPGHQGARITCIATSQDGSVALTGAEDGSGFQWTLPGGVAMARLWGHQSPIEGAAISLDKRLGVTIAHDGVGNVWDLRLPHAVADWQEPLGGTGCVVITPDGQKVISTGRDGDVVLRPLPRRPKLPEWFEPLRVLARSGEELDLMPWIDPARDNVQVVGYPTKNRWERSGSELHFPADPRYGRLVFPVYVLGNDYELELEVTRTSGTEGFNVDLPTSRGLLPVEIGAYQQVSFGGAIDTVAKYEFPSGQRRRVQIRAVRQDDTDELTLTVEGTPFTRFRGRREAICFDEHQFKTEFARGLMALWIHKDSAFTFHTIRLRMLQGEVRSRFFAR